MKKSKIILVDWLGKTDFFVREISNYQSWDILSCKVKGNGRVSKLMRFIWLCKNILHYFLYIPRKDCVFIFNIPFLPQLEIFLIKIGRIWRNKYILILHNDNLFHDGKSRDTQFYLGEFDEIVVHDPVAASRFSEFSFPVNFRWLPYIKINIDKVSDLDIRPFSSSEIFSILFIGQVRKYKGLEVFLKALGEMKQEDKRKISVSIVGKHFYDVSYDVINTREFSEFIIVNEYVSDLYMRNCIARSDLIVLPYLESSGSAVCSMAVQNRKMFLASNLPFFKEFTEFFSYGELFDVGNSLSMASKIREIIKSYPKNFSNKPLKNEEHLLLVNYIKFLKDLAEK
jgi:glycosyltransferase involved in cell wall biosynthesis